MKTLPFFFNQCLDKKRLKKMILWSLNFQGEHKTLQMIENLKTLGFQYATSAGVSLSIDDLTIPTKKRTEVLESEAAILRSVQGRAKGNRTAIEEIQTVIDTWHRTSETVKEHVIDFFEATDVLNPVYMMAFSGARGNVSQVRQLVGMRGLMADPKGDIIGYAIRSNFREGLTITEYMISAYGARKGVVDTALRTADAGYLTRRLVDVAQHIIIQQGSCGTKKGILLGPIRDGGKFVLRVEDRLLGRVLARDIWIHGQKIASRNDAIDEELTSEIANALHSQSDQEAKIFVRSPLTCDLRNGVCQLCYGWSFTQNRMVPIGEAVGVIAGQSIGEPGTQLTMRTFHTGGVFTGEVQGQFRAPHGGSIHYPKAFPGVLVRTPYGQIAFLVKEAGTLIIHDEVNNRRTELAVPSHSALFLREGETVQRRQILALPGGLDEGGNDKVETRKIVFSDFDGEVIYENVSRRKARFPEDISVIMKRILEKMDEEERKALGKKPRKKRKPPQKFVGEKRAKKYKKKEWYTLTDRVGTLWILAGRKLDPFYKTLPIFHDSGHLVEPNTLLGRQALLSPEEGFICREKRSMAEDQTIAQLPPSSTYQLDQEIDENALVTTIEASDNFPADEAWIYQPRLHTTYTTLRFDILKNTLTIRNRQGNIFVIPDYTQQIGDQERRHLIDYRDYGQQSTMKTVLYPWRTTLGWTEETDLLRRSVKTRRRGTSKAREQARHLELFSYQPDNQIHDAAVFVWQDDLFRNPSYRHGQLFLTPYAIHPIKRARIDFDHLQKGWMLRTSIDTSIAHSFQPAKTLKMGWVGEGETIYAQPNLQNQISTMKAKKAGLCTILQKDPMTLVPASPQIVMIKGRSDERPDENQNGQKNPREKDLGPWRLMGEIPFPFFQEEQEEKTAQATQAEKAIIEHSPGWLYLPNQKSLRSGRCRRSFVSPLPKFHGQTVFAKPLFMTMECRHVPAQQTTVQSLYTKVMPTVPNYTVPEFTRLEGQVQQASLLPSIRLISLLRHPRLVPFLEKEVKNIQTHIARFTILSHAKNPFYTLFGHDSKRLVAQTGRLAFEPAQSEKPVKDSQSMKTGKIAKSGKGTKVRKTKTIQINQIYFDYVLYPLQGAVDLPIFGKQSTPPTPMVSPQEKGGYSKERRSYFMSFGLLYQTIREFSLDRISHTTKKLTNSFNFEINPVVQSHNVSAPIVMEDVTNQTTVYTALQSAYCETEKGLLLKKNFSAFQETPRIEVKETATCTFWSKQGPSRLVPNERAQVASILPCILPAGSYLQEHDFMCRFLVRFKPVVEQKENGGSWKLNWNPPWQPKTSMVSTASTMTISFVKRPRFHTKDDEIFHPPATWLPYGDIFTRRRSYMQAHGEVIRTSSNNCFILEEKDTQSFTLKDLRRVPTSSLSKTPMSKGLTAMGSILRFGEEVQPGVGTPISGQIIAFTPTTITLRKAQPILFYDSGSIHVQDGQSITKGHPLVTLSYQRLITGDIVQGIPKVEQLFEGSQAKDKETEMKLSDMLAMTFNGLRITTGLSNQEAFEKSIRMIQHKIIENIQKVYLSQGVSIADIHFEVIVRRMTSWGKIRDVGNSGLFRDEIMPIQRIERINGGIFGTKAQYEPVIVGISASASNAESFLSAASFQETSRVLTRDAIEGKTDFLRGVKERVILGDLIPTGTGFIEHAAYIADPPKPWKI